MVVVFIVYALSKRKGVNYLFSTITYFIAYRIIKSYYIFRFYQHLITCFLLISIPANGIIKYSVDFFSIPKHINRLNHSGFSSGSARFPSSSPKTSTCLVQVLVFSIFAVYFGANEKTREVDGKAVFFSRFVFWI